MHRADQRLTDDGATARLDSKAEVIAARACVPSRAEPVSSRTDSGSAPVGDDAAGGLDQ